MSETPLITPKLPAIGILAALSDDDRDLLSSYGDFLSFRAKQPVIEQNKPQDCLYIVVSGALQVKRDIDSHQLILRKIMPGESFGEINIFDPDNASASVEALEFTQLWRIVREDLEDFLETSPVAGGNLLVGIASSLSRRLRQADGSLLEAQIAILKNSF